MKIRISKENLLHQLPDGDLPDFIILDGAPHTEMADPNIDKYPKAFNVLGRIEWIIFSELLHGEIVSQRTIASFCRPKQFNFSNLAVTHVKNLRRKIRIHSLPFSIQTIPGMGYRMHRM